MIWDLHIHSQYSFDGNVPIDELCHAASQHHMDMIAITDHCNMLPGPEGYRAYLAGEADRLKEIEQAHRDFPALELLLGIEIGNAVNMPEKTRHFLSQRKFDFIIGVIHFLPDGSDIYKLAYEGEDTVDPLVEPVLEGLVRQQIALESNTRGTYDWQHRVGPEDWVLARHREFGGWYITIGSDAHTPDRVGAGFAQAAAALRRTGFSELRSTESDPQANANSTVTGDQQVTSKI